MAAILSTRCRYLRDPGSRHPGKRKHRPDL